ncbi:Alcohol dehydrogenase zinc-binding domain protein [Beutenbergia cavernae DSM 12333]|uniref:Alcohol dehydrogenase zinc-binding domain protein n=1 Tax=Beutenbergia cavernae (strain ATCC BAA-8 / DSM 12333 / CCUG 43141 / JCM 11478 / NBRC 16432 / NCIMB 13614 / HKI 0122) TaxID=471853 RepID=C5C3N0_BEUC1|nr:NAD(P)-dependent alcohol dehydrogenase [Beutenbergia cavernae]ACQ81939.1 Alcohol dehydrogenase zinc-binding domain protein [Beutenbergia cavernae DSM 12333]
MRAVVQDGYGRPDRLRVENLPVPQPAADEVLVRVRASSLHPDVWHVVAGRPLVLRLMGAGVRGPRQVVPGTDLSGEITAVGSGVTGLAVGDDVFGETLRGIQWVNGGAWAEYAVAPAAALARKPDGVTHEQAASVPTAGLIALANLPDRGRSLAGQRVLVNGAAGGVGSIVVAVAVASGATVTAVDAADRLEMVRSLGVDRVLDYRVEDFTAGPDTYDLIVDIPGNHSYAACRRVLTPQGRYVLIGHDGYGSYGHRWLGGVPRQLGLMARAPFSRHLDAGVTQPAKADSMADLRALLEDGRLRPAVGRTYPLEEAAQALAALASGSVHGRIVLVP